MARMSSRSKASTAELHSLDAETPASLIAKMPPIFFHSHCRSFCVYFYVFVLSLPVVRVPPAVLKFNSSTFKDLGPDFQKFLGKILSFA